MQKWTQAEEVEVVDKAKHGNEDNRGDAAYRGNENRQRGRGD